MFLVHSVEETEILTHLDVEPNSWQEWIHQASLVAQTVKKNGSFQSRDWVGKIPWRKAWEPMPVFLPGESPWTEEHGRLLSMRRQSQTQLRHWAQYDLSIWSFDNHCLPSNFFAGNFLSLGSQSETGHTDLFFFFSPIYYALLIRYLKPKILEIATSTR